MRILQISSARHFGGGEKHFADLCRGLTERGHEVSVAVRPHADWLARLSFLSEKNFFYLPLRNSLDASSALKLAKIIRRGNFEIVHAHPARDYSVASLAVRLAKTAKLVLTRHVFFRLNSLHRLLLPESAMLIAPTKEGRRKLLQQNLLPPEQIKLIYPGVDTKYFAEAAGKTVRADLCRQLNLSPEKKFVGIAGEITEHKGQLDFVRAAKIVLQDFPAAEFLIAGQDSSAAKSHLLKLKNLIENLNLQNKIHLLGFWNDVAPLYSILDVFVSASRVEPFGLVIAEASAAGCPVAATATAGAREIIIDGVTGKLVPVKDAEALAGAIKEFLGNKAVQDEFAENARLRIAENFDLEQMISKIEELYGSLFPD